jgi:predicted nucleic acid-binding Zn ribbon protein
MEVFMFSALMDRFSRKSPLTVMTRALLENIFAPDKLNAILEQNRRSQRNRKWLFSSVVDLMVLVVCQIRPSVRAAYRSRAEQTPPRSAVSMTN